MKFIKLLFISLLLLIQTGKDVIASEQEVNLGTQIQILINSDKHDEAKAKLDELLSNEPNNHEYLSLAANLYLNIQELDEAEEYIDKVLKFPKPTEKDWLLASMIFGMQAQESSIFSKLGYAKKAKKSLESLLKLNPESEEGLIGLIQFHMAAPGIAGGDEDLVPELMEKLKPISPVRYSLMKAQPYFAEEEFNKGLSVIEEGLVSNPNSIELLFVKAIQLSQVQQYQESFDTFASIHTKPLPEDPSGQEELWHEMSQYQAAKVSAEYGVSLAKGKEYMYTFMDSDQTQVEESWIRFRLGQILWQLEEKDFAKAQFELIPSLKPEKELKKRLKGYLKKHRIKL